MQYHHHVQQTPGGDVTYAGTAHDRVTLRGDTLHIFLSRILILCFAAVLCMSCAKKDPAEAFYGTWTATQVSAFGQTLSAAEAAAADWMITIEKNGKASLTSGADAQEMTWTSAEEGIVMAATEDGTTYTFPARIEEAHLIVTMLDFMDVYFVK